jgi:fibro-slime domain-containing protein
MIHAHETLEPTPGPSGGGHPDFEAFTASGKGLVRVALGADDEPVWASNTPIGATSACLTGSVDFCWWYHERGCSGDGSANPYDKLVYLDAAGAPTTLTLAQQAVGSNIYSYSTSAFFPLDGLGWNAGKNPEEDAACDGTTGHNFSFTSELHFVFTYQAAAAATSPPVFTFSGDDDVYGFINTKLVIDLGGIHPGQTQSVTLDTAKAATLGLTDGGWYSIDVFQAERLTCGSDYGLTLSGFTHVVSQCRPICGDHIVTGDEQCDTGADNSPSATAYGKGLCTTDCRLAPYCGDATVEAQLGEQCDDGTNLATYGGTNPHVCGPGCKWAPYCGDGMVQSQFGEQCDGTPDCSSTCGPAAAR